MVVIFACVYNYCTVNEICGFVEYVCIDWNTLPCNQNIFDTINIKGIGWLNVLRFQLTRYIERNVAWHYGFYKYVFFLQGRIASWKEINDSSGMDR